MIVAIVALQSVTMTFDWGQIMASVAPTLAVLIPGVIAVVKILKQGKATHVLVNDQLTREKSTRLLDAQANRELLEITMLATGKSLTSSQRALLAALDTQIAGLAAEVRQRDIAAGTLIPKGQRRTSDSLTGGGRAADPPTKDE